MVTWRPSNVDGLDFSDRALIVTALRAYQSQVEAERNGSMGNGVASFAMEYISGRLGHLAEVIDPERDGLAASS
jgi:hypothetical protein